MHVDPAQLRLLALIGRHGSLAAAADELGLTPAAISGQVARAEALWDTALVQRGPRGARLTDAGKTLAVSGAMIDDLCLDADRRMRAQLPLLQTRLRVGTFQSAAQHLLPPALTALHHRNTRAAITVTEIDSSDGAILVAEGDLDIAVVATYVGRLAVPDGLAAHHLLDDPLVVCLPEEHRLARATPPDRPLHLTQLHDDHWIAILTGHPAREQFDAATTRAGLTPAVVMETGNYNVAQSIVATGIASALLSRLTISPTPGATFRRLGQPRLNRRIWAVSRSDTRYTPLVADALALLHEVAADLAQSWRNGPH
jgi:molybdate transport repressor ModE-like protein